jgi:anti-anti-sigma regulatory factor
MVLASQTHFRVGSSQRKELMVLKITRVASLDQEVTLQLDGRVTGPWVELLHQYAESVLAEGARLTLNLQNVYFIDCEGVGLIKSLMDREVQVDASFFVAEQIKKCGAEQGD